MMRIRICMFVVATLGLFAGILPRGVGAETAFDVKAYGAVGDGVALDTKSIQAAIDAANGAGGGEVVIPPGRYVTVTLELKSGVTLTIKEGAVLQASASSTDWRTYDLKPVIGATGQLNVAIRGPGVIDGGGSSYYDARGEFAPGPRPQTLIYIRNSTNVTVSNLTLQNSVRWTQVYDECDRLTVDGVRVRNPEYGRGRETDGIDVNSSRDVLVQNCDIETGDDGICLKPQPDPWQKPARTMHGVVVRNCVVASTCNAVKIGTGTSLDAYDVTFDGITVKRHSDVRTNHNPIKADRFGSTNGSCIAAISVQSNDGGLIHDISFRNFNILDCDTPIFIEVQNRQSIWAHADFGSVYAISFFNIDCARSARASQINTQQGGRVEDILFDNVRVHNYETYTGHASPPRLTGEYPDAQRYGRMPACGLFARDVEGLRISPACEFADEGKSGRPTTAFEDVTTYPR